MKPTLLDLGSTKLNPIHIKIVDVPYLDTPFHFHPYCELVLILKGDGQRVVGDHIADYSPNDLVLVGPNLPHIWRSHSSDTTNNTFAIVIYFQPSFFDKIVDETMRIKIDTLFAKASRGLQAHGRLLSDLRSEMVAISKLDGFALTHKFIDIIEMLLKSENYTFLSSSGYQKILTSKDALRIDRIYRYMMDNFRRPITLEEVADISNLTPTSFCRFFKQCTQKSFSRFVNEMRISHACRLIGNRNLSINQICTESGFQNITNFNRFFKLHTGVSPREYRKQLLEITDLENN